MALVTGDFFTISILPTSDPAWASLVTQPDIPAAITALIVTGATFEVYCLDAATGDLVCEEAGRILGFVDAILASCSAAYPKLTTTSTSGDVFISGLNTASLWRVYDPESVTLLKYGPIAASALKAFLP